MGFWNTSDGVNVAENAETEYDNSGGFILIPDDSSVMAIIDDAGWAKDDSFNRYISLRWNVVKPDAVENVKIFHKLWVSDPDPKAKDPAKKRDKALRMLSAIDANCGGKLARLKDEPTDDQLAIAITNKPMVIKVKVWEMNGSEGNWVAAVSPKTKALDLKAMPEKAKANAGGFGDDLGDEVPF